MKKKFKWVAISIHNPKGPVVHEGKEWVDNKKQFLCAIVWTRMGGRPNKALATIDFSCGVTKWKISKVFEGRNSSRQARAWCNFFLNYPPSSIGKS